MGADVLWLTGILVDGLEKQQPGNRVFLVLQVVAQDPFSREPSLGYSVTLC